MDWFYTKNGQRIGPLQAEGIRALIISGELGPDDLVWNKTMGENWAKLSDVYIFSVNFQKPNAAKDIEFAKRLEEKREKESREKALGSLRTAIGMIAVVAIAIGWFLWNQGKDHRLRGVDNANPIGSFAKYDALFADTFKMEKLTPPANEFVPDPTGTAFTYWKPKNGLGAHVNAGGSITLVANGDHIDEVYSDFPASGQRGPLWLDKCVVGIEIETLWKLIGAPEHRDMKQIKNAPAGIAEKYGLTKLPAAGTYDTFDGPTVSALWVEHSLYCASTIVIIKAK